VCANATNAVKKRFELVDVGVVSTLVTHPLVLDLLVLTSTLPEIFASLTGIRCGI